MPRNASRVRSGAFIADANAQRAGITKDLALTAAGSTQADALAITADTNVCTTVASGTGVRLPAFVNAGDIDESMIIVNGGANSLSIYPASGSKINNLSADAAYALAAGKSVEVIRVSATQWVTVGA